jgi:hypothetical protein
MRSIPKYDFRHFFKVQGGPRGVDIGTKQPVAEKEQILTVLWIHAFAEKNGLARINKGKTVT